MATPGHVPDHSSQGFGFTNNSFFQSTWDSMSGRNDTNRHKTPSLSQLFQNFGISHGLQQHLYKIYSTLGLMLLAASIGSFLSYDSPPRPWLWGISQFIAMIWFAFSSSETKFINLVNLQSVLLYFIAGTTGILINPLLHMAFNHNDIVVPLAFASTTIIFASFTIIALKVDRVAVLYLYSGIAMIFGLLSFYSLIISLFGMNLLPTMFWTSIGMVFTLFMIVLDTQNIILRYEEAISAGAQPNEINYKQDVLAMFLNFIKLFVRTLHLLIQFTSKKKDNENNRRNRN